MGPMRFLRDRRGVAAVEFALIAPVLILLYMGEIGIYPQKYYEEVGPEGMGTKPVGTGPYKISVWNNEEIIGTAFEEGWRVPRIKNLHILELPENSSRLQALCSGQVDIANQLTPDDAAQKD